MLLLSLLLGSALMAILGWFRGARVLLQGLLALLVASLLATPFGILAKPIAKALGAPELLAPTAGTILAGFAIFCAALLGFHLYSKKQEDKELPSWDKPVGALTGGVWGVFLVLFIFTGLNSIARADRAMREAEAVSQLRTEARKKVERTVVKDMKYMASQYAPEEYERRKAVAVAKKMKKFKPDPKKVEELVKPGTLDPFLQELKAFPLKAPVNAFSPVDEKSEKVLRDLSIVVSDPILFERFRREAVVKELMEDETVKALASDPKIAEAVRANRFRELLDHPKLVAAARSSVVRKKFKNVDIEALLEQVLAY